jgi:hypothetical protein
MTTIRDALAVEVHESTLAHMVMIEFLERLGIDPDADEHSILVVQRSKCPTCEGKGEVCECPGVMLSLPDARCPTCDGKRYVPAKWATVDACLDWLRDHGAGELASAAGPTHSHGYGVVMTNVWTGDGPTLHAALIAACVAVQEAGQ